jgi:hypothetical protein
MRVSRTSNVLPCAWESVSFAQPASFEASLAKVRYSRLCHWPCASASASASREVDGKMGISAALYADPAAETVRVVVILAVGYYDRAMFQSLDLQLADNKGKGKGKGVLGACNVDMEASLCREQTRTAGHELRYQLSAGGGDR